MADPPLPRGGRQPLSLWQKPIIWQDFCQKLRGKKRNWTKKGAHVHSAPLGSANENVFWAILAWNVIDNKSLASVPIQTIPYNSSNNKLWRPLSPLASMDENLLRLSMHSSRMRTARLLLYPVVSGGSVCPGAGGKVSAQGGVCLGRCLPRGVSA